MVSGDVLDCCVVGDDLVEPGAPARNRFEQRRTTLESDRPNTVPFDRCRQQDLLKPLWRWVGPWDQKGRGPIRGPKSICIRLFLFLAKSLQPKRQCAFAHFGAGDIRGEVVFICCAFTLRGDVPKMLRDRLG